MKERITRVRSDEAVKEDLSDWQRVRSMTDEEIEAAIADDPDASLGLDGEFGPVRGLVFKDLNGEWRWRLMGADGKAIADSPRSYTDRQEVDLAIRALREAILAGERKSRAA